MAKEASLDDCLKLLKGDSDEQRLVGLLLATKFVKGDDLEAVRKVFDAIGFQFINRLLKTGSGEVGRGADKRQAYLHLALSILAAFCRLPELAASEEVIAKVPVFVTTLGSKQDGAAAGDCYECLLAVSISSEQGMQALLKFNALTAVVRQLNDSPPDAPWFPVGIKLLHTLLAKVAAEGRIAEYAQDFTYVIPAVASQLAFRQDTVKFEALSILYSLLVSDISTLIKEALRGSVHLSQWPAHARIGLGQILHSRVAIEQKYLVLELAESIVELVGDAWLTGSIEFPGQQGQAPPDRFFLLVAETLRVETAVILNEVAQAAFESGESAEAESSKTAEAASVRQRRLMTCFALLEHVITIVATQEDSSKQMQQTTLQKTLVALDEVVGIVLEFLEDAQKHHQNRGDVLVASVRIVSRYLAEAPFAHQERCHRLLSFLLSISTSSESRPFLAVQFMVPYLTQVTLEPNGCKLVIASGSHIQIVNFLSWLIVESHATNGCLVDVCDIFLNLLTKNKHLDGINGGDFIPVIPAFVAWVGRGLSRMESAMAASVLTCVLGLTDEDQLLRSPEVGPGGLRSVLQVITSNVEQCLKIDRSAEQDHEEDLLEIILSGLVACINRYPSFKLELKARVQSIIGNRGLSQIQDVTTNPTLQQLLITVLRK
ncbi:unnamed protein product [Calypogeia fissa]